MAEIVWGPYQVQHIERRHGVTAEQFDEAFHDPLREDVERRPDGSTLSHAFTDTGRLLEMVWRYRGARRHAVFPITAHVVDGPSEDADEETP